MSVARRTSTFPGPTSPATVLVMPKDNVSWRIVTAFITWSTSAVVANRRLNLSITDGAGNSIAVFAGGNVPASSGANSTFASQVLQSGVNAGGFEQITIPDDVWIQPQWNVSFAIDTQQAGDAITFANVQIEQYVRTKEVAPAPRAGQDTPP